MIKKPKKFWDKEYKKPAFLAISTEPSDDLEKFCRWLERNYGRQILNPLALAVDLGCGNGRNLIYLAKEFGCRGVGYDSSSEAIKLASGGAASLDFHVRSIREPIPLADNSVSLVLDMMSSHILRVGEREKLRAEILRVLKPSGWLLFKTFLLEEDDHAKRLLHDSPADEPGSYIHPHFNQLEHVWTIPEIEEFFGADFEIHKIEKSHKHRSHGHAFRRRTVTVYLEKKS